MLATIKVGSEIDIASGDELAMMGDKLATAINQPEPRPIYLSRSQSAISTGGVMTIDVGAPPVGSIWQLRHIALFGSDDHTVLSGITAALYCGDPYNVSLAQLKLPGLAIPSSTFIPDTCIWCHPNENVVIQTGQAVTAGQQVGFVITVEEWLEGDVSRMSGRG